MSAYSTYLDKPKCQMCGAPARFKVWNGVNALDGYYCPPHKDRRIQELDTLAKGQADADRKRD